MPDSAVMIHPLVSLSIILHNLAGSLGGLKSADEASEEGEAGGRCFGLLKTHAGPELYPHVKLKGQTDLA
jgi:hypothetical protein